MELFHASGLWYVPDDTIPPGNWGRVLQGAGPSHHFYYREALFEWVRIHSASDSASRLRSLFGFTDLPSAQRYQAKEGVAHLYRVEVADRMAATHDGDLSVFTLLSQARDVADACAAVERYWQGDRLGGDREILIEAPGLVVERLP